MRNLYGKELESVSGGEWSFEVDLGVVKFTISGDESIQEMVSGAYFGARDAMADAFTAWDPAGYYDSGCSGGGR